MFRVLESFEPGLKKLYHSDFQFFGQKLPQIRTKYPRRTPKTYKTLKGRYQGNFRKKINHY